MLTSKLHRSRRAHSTPKIRYKISKSSRNFTHRSTIARQTTMSSTDSPISTQDYSINTTALDVAQTHQSLLEDKNSRFNRTAQSDHILDTEVYSPEEIAELERQLAENHKGQVMQSYYRQKLDQQATGLWNKFYKRNNDNFFKDRHYLHREIPALITMNTHYENWYLAHAKKVKNDALTVEESQLLEQFPDAPPRPVLAEVGCGVGNAFWPILEDFPQMNILGCDCSSAAIDLIKAQPQYDHTRVNVSVCDISKQVLPFEDNSADIVTLIFTASALTHDYFPHLFSECFRILKPNGVFYIRDYALYDLTMMRFKKGQRLHTEEPLFARGDGTRTYFFSREKLSAWITGAGFDLKNDDIKYVKKIVENIKEGKVMHRRWIVATASKLPVDNEKK